MTTWLTTRENVQESLDVSSSARSNKRVDRAIAAASLSVEKMLLRTFRPVVATYSFPWPAPDTRTSYWRLWLDALDLISVTTLQAGGETIDAADYFLEPTNTGPPYRRVEIDLSSTSSFTSQSATFQRSITIAGLWGHSNTERTAGALDGLITDSATTLNVTDASEIGVGDVIVIDSERMNVTGRSWLDTTVNTGGALTDVVSDRTLAVSDGTLFAEGEVLLVNSEQMIITDIAGNNLTVRRGWNGSVLAAHSSGDDIYASRTLTVERGLNGTTAASHADAASISAHVVPSAVDSLTVSEAQILLGAKRAGQAAESGAENNARSTTGSAIAMERHDVWVAYGRKARFRSVG